PGIASVAGPPASGGGDLRVVRPPVPHRDGLEEAGSAAGSGPPLQRDETDLPEAGVPRLGEGADLPRRQPAGFDLQRRGTGQPPASQDAEDGVSGPNSSDDPRPDRTGHVPRDPRSVPRGDVEDTPPREAAIILDNGAKVSFFPQVSGI